MPDDEKDLLESVLRGLESQDCTLQEALTALEQRLGWSSPSGHHASTPSAPWPQTKPGREDNHAAWGTSAPHIQSADFQPDSSLPEGPPFVLQTGNQQAGLETAQSSFLIPSTLAEPTRGSGLQT